MNLHYTVMKACGDAEYYRPLSDLCRLVTCVESAATNLDAF